MKQSKNKGLHRPTQESMINIVLATHIETMMYELNGSVCYCWFIQVFARIYVSVNDAIIGSEIQYSLVIKWALRRILGIQYQWYIWPYALEISECNTRMATMGVPQRAAAVTMWVHCGTPTGTQHRNRGEMITLHQLPGTIGFSPSWWWYLR